MRHALSLRELDQQCKKMIKLVDKYFDEFPNHEEVDPATAITLYASTNPKADESELLMAQDYINSAKGDADTDTIRGLLRSLQELAYATDLSKVLMEYEEGGDIDVFEQIDLLKRQYEMDLKRHNDFSFIDEDVDDMLNDAVNGVKYNWRLKPLRKSMPNMEAGDQIIVALRPGKGKTTFMADQLVHMVKQIPDGRPAVWLNNEGKGRKVRRTLFRAALSCTMEDMVNAGSDAVKAAWLKEVGPLDCIRVFDIHGKTNTQLEDIFIEHNPGIVVWDMLDNVHGFDGDKRVDQRLESLYQWSREMAVQYDFLSLPTSQLSDLARGVQWCDQAMLKDSRTGKQGACETIITIGDSEDPMKARDRYIYVPKTKYTPVPGARGDCMTTVQFQPEIAHYADPLEM